MTDSVAKMLSPFFRNSDFFFIPGVCLSTETDGGVCHSTVERGIASTMYNVDDLVSREVFITCNSNPKDPSATVSQVTGPQ